MKTYVGFIVLPATKFCHKCTVVQYSIYYIVDRYV